MFRLVSILLAAAALAVAGCGSDSGSGSGDSGAAATEATPATGSSDAADDETQEPDGAATSDGPADTRGTVIQVSGSQFGGILYNGDKQAIYLFDKEKTSRSECYDECAEEWPPVLTTGEPRAGSGADDELLGTTKRDDGKTQVTYNGHPLYYYAHEGSGEVKCHNVSGFGGLWLVLDPAGDARS